MLITLESTIFSAFSLLWRNYVNEETEQPIYSLKRTRKTSTAKERKMKQLQTNFEYNKITF